MRILVLLLCLMPCVVYSQLSVDFESGTIEPWVCPVDQRWALDDDNPISGIYSLKHIYDNQESGTDVAFIPLNGLKMERERVIWKFRIRHGYMPSSSNKWAVILASDQEPDPDISGGTMNGLVLGVNISGYDDTLSIWKQSYGEPERVIKTNINWQNDIGTAESPELIIERDPGGIWRIFLRHNEEIPFLIGTGSESSCSTSGYFGIYYRYTSSCDQLLWIDDIEIHGCFEEDNKCPEISDVRFNSSHSIRVSFDEPLQVDVLLPDKFSVSSADIHPDNINVINSQTLDLEFGTPFMNKTSYRLEARNICDNSGNCADSLFIDLFMVYPEWGDLVITEIMTDPSPSVDLPEIEYFEIYNRSPYSFNLRSVIFQNGGSSSTFPDQHISPGSYIAVCDDDDTSMLRIDHPVIGLRSMPSLNNTSDYILLCDTLSGTIHGLNYDIGWFNNHLKNDGGWSLEMIDSNYPFAGSENWSFSTNVAGGTPGGQNSVKRTNADISEPYIANCFARSPESIKVDFSEPVINLVNHPHQVQIEGMETGEIRKLDSLRRSYEIVPGDKLKDGVVYTIDFENTLDCAGNNLNPSFCQAGLVQKPLPGDIIINEILFDALHSEPEFIEFYNSSDRVIDAAELLTTCINLQSGDTGAITYLAAESRAILPGDYFAITEEKETLAACYFSSDPEKIYKVNRLTSLPDDRGRILLLYKDLTIIDDFTYYSDYHSDIISEKAGVSLERISPEISSDTPSNWHSATGLSGWGTPGLENSVYMRTDLRSESSLSLSSSKITPDNDGFEDYLTITLNMEEGEWVVDIIIFDDQGTRVSYLCEKMSAFGTETIIWNGTDSNGRLLPSGIYIVFVKAVSASGMISKWKKVCSVLRL